MAKAAPVSIHVGENNIRTGPTDNLFSGKTGDILRCLDPVSYDPVFIDAIETVVEVVEKYFQVLLEFLHKNIHTIANNCVTLIVATLSLLLLYHQIESGSQAKPGVLSRVKEYSWWFGLENREN